MLPSSFGARLQRRWLSGSGSVASEDERLLSRLVGEFRSACGLSVRLQTGSDGGLGDLVGCVPVAREGRLRPVDLGSMDCFASASLERKQEVALRM